MKDYLIGSYHQEKCIKNDIHVALFSIYVLRSSFIEIEDNLERAINHICCVLILTFLDLKVIAWSYFLLNYLSS